MKEIEVKIIEIDKENIVKQLLDLGAEKVFEGEIYSISYDSEDNQLSKNKSFIRLRKKGDKSYLSFKKRFDDEESRIMEEQETEVSDFEQTRNILESLGLNSYKDYTKKRITYKIGDVLFEIDEYKEIPIYMEIEAPTIQQINKYIEKLGINKDKVKPWGGGQLMRHYGVEVGSKSV